MLTYYINKFINVLIKNKQNDLANRIIKLRDDRYYFDAEFDLGQYRHLEDKYTYSTGAIANKLGVSTKRLTSVLLESNIIYESSFGFCRLSKDYIGFAKLFPRLIETKSGNPEDNFIIFELIWSFEGVCLLKSIMDNDKCKMENQISNFVECYICTENGDGSTTDLYKAYLETGRMTYKDDFIEVSQTKFVRTLKEMYELESRRSDGQTKLINFNLFS